VKLTHYTNDERGDTLTLIFVVLTNRKARSQGGDTVGS
jgi:hypothetical protein